MFSDGLGYVLGEDNIVLSRQAKETNPSLHTMSDSRVIASVREFHRLSPRLLLEMRDHPERLAERPDETIDGKTLSVVSWKADDAEWIVLFGDDGLPARIRTVDADGVWGDCNYDMILSDWRLRGQENGVEAVKAVRAITGEATPAMLVTGDTSTDLLKMAHQSGLVVLHKPLQPKHLVRLIKHLRR